MKIFLLRSGEKRRDIGETTPTHAIAEGTCPCCGVEPFKIAGSGQRPSDDDRAFEADGFCIACGKHVGTIRAEVSTIFGVREDTVVLKGRCRVY